MLNNLVYMFLSLGIVFCGGYLMGTADTQKKIERELLEQQVIFNSQVKKIEKDFSLKQKDIVTDYLDQIEKQRTNYEQQLQEVKQNNPSDTMDVDTMCNMYVNRLHTNKNKTSDRKLSTERTGPNVFCYTKDELYRKIEASMVITRECDELAIKYKSLLQVCNDK